MPRSVFVWSVGVRLKDHTTLRKTRENRGRPDRGVDLMVLRGGAARCGKSSSKSPEMWWLQTRISTDVIICPNQILKFTWYNVLFILLFSLLGWAEHVAWQQRRRIGVHSISRTPFFQSARLNQTWPHLCCASSCWLQLISKNAALLANRADYC